MRCLIVLPCFNEEENIKPLVYSINNVLKQRVPYKIIAVNDGSCDRTSEILKDLSTDYPIRVVEHEVNRGLGAALRTGLITAASEAFDYDLVITMDSDNTHDPKHVLDMIMAIEGTGADVVVGSRYVDGGMQLNVSPHRKFLSRVVNVLIGKIFRIPVKDATSGFRCFRAKLLKKLYAVFMDRIIESRGFEASFELLLKVVRSGGLVIEVPILLDYGRKSGYSKMRLFSTVVRYLTLIFKFKRLDILRRFD
jgi:dolichol-phosphate mannosyltransferase